MRKMPQDAFASEQELLNQAKSAFRQEGMPYEELLSSYAKLITDYEKLLKTASKIARISDIQGRMLKEREQEIKKANESLGHMEKQRKKLISDISHELRTPMTSIQGYIKAMSDNVIPANDEYLTMIYHKIELVNQLVTDLFQLSKLESGMLPFEFRTMTVEQLLLPYTNKFEMEACKAGITYDTRMLRQLLPSCRQCTVLADPFRIEQVMTNLVHNAMKFTSRGGDIRIDAELCTEDGQGSVMIRVADTGIGIPEEHLPYVFDRFYRVNHEAERQAAGTGLGLAICKEIVDRHQGTLGVMSLPGEGSTFYFSLPMTKA